MTETEAKLKEARAELEALQDDQERYRDLVNDNASELDSLDAKDLQARVEAKSRLSAAKELSAQHEADMQGRSVASKRS